MVTKTVESGLIALAAVLIPFAQPVAAQDYKGTPKATVQEYGPFKNPQYTNRNVIVENAAGRCGNPAGTCLFYGGDFTPNLLGPPFLNNALANESTTVIPGSPYGAATWVPFTVPAGDTWAVTGLFSNNMSTYGVLDQGVQPLSAAYWSINEGIYAGNPGTVVASGTSAATSTATGRAAFGLTEFTVQVTGLSVTLTGGSYWLAVVPLCTNTADPFCGGVFFLSDVEYIDSRPMNAFGPAEPVDGAFFDSAFFGVTFEPSNGGAGACAGDGCDAFSAGILGKKER